MATFVLFVCLSIAVRSAAASDANNATSHLLHEACKQVSDADLCINALSVCPESEALDFHGLAGLAIREAASVAGNTSSYISGLLDEGKIEDEDIQQCLYDCEESFIDASEQLEQSTVAMDKAYYQAVNLWVMMAKAEGQVCDKGCKNTVPSDMKVNLDAQIGEFSKLCSIVLNMTTFLAASY